VLSTSVTSTVLDASALLAFLNSEPGAEVVRGVLHDAIISAVNYSEILKKTIERNGSPERVSNIIRDLAVAIIPFDEAHAAVAATLYPAAKPHGMSFADRACLSLGVMRRITVLTAERKMKLLTLPIKVKLIRNAN
jgi:PIN domain nuclease of toxin-antitoxin system